MLRVPTRLPAVLTVFILSIFPAAVRAADPEPFDTEKDTGVPMPAEEAAAAWDLPDGFRATVFAAEPDVRQPIAMCLDARGRLWVAEGYTYAGHAGGYYEKSLRDRIVVFEDTDGDGRHDKRTVFADGLARLTSIEVGFGGVWALTLPNLVFIPDRNRDDVPDGPAEVVLDGFDIANSAHTLANGLRWGPDGWLYGRQGILGLSAIGVPGAPDSARVRLNPGIWRVHPQRHTVEVVCEGTTNPWGMDWNEYGEAFFINTVIGHLWHVIPGAHYRRMFGEDLNPRVYHLIDQHADHVHWDTREVWSDVRTIGVSDASSSAGGGHAHTGLMVYLGDNWPDEYRGGMFTINFHGRRLNHDRLEPTGSGYVGRHDSDLAQSADPWFRGIDLLYGPDGSVFVSDWSDAGECHDDDGVHRLSGRIYRISRGTPAAPDVADVAAASSDQLVSLLAHRNAWFARQAQLELQARAAAGADLAEPMAAVRRMFAESGDVVHRLRALWTLHATGRADAGFLRAQLADPSEHVRGWAVRLLAGENDGGADPENIAALAACAESEGSPRVRLALASALQRLPLPARPAVAKPLLARAEDAADHNLPLMLWYGIEALGDSHAAALADLAAHCRLPLTLTCIARRLAEDLSDPSGALRSLLATAATAPANRQFAILTGLAEAVEGTRPPGAPPGWSELAAALSATTDEPLQRLYRSLGSAFGDPAAHALNHRVALDAAAPADVRAEALRSLVNARADGLAELCRSLIAVPGLTPAAAAGLGLDDDPAIAAFLLENLPAATPDDRPSVIDVLLNRPGWTERLLDAVEAGSVPASDLGAYHIRRIHAFRRDDLSKRAAELWGESRESDAGKVALVSRWKSLLTPAVLATADKAAGRALFASLCGTCHKMFGAGGDIGPDLTGSGRDNLDYLLTNIVDPGAVVARDQRVTIVTMKDGRVLSGIVRRNDGRVVALQTIVGQTTLPAADIESTEIIAASLMPEGLLNALQEHEVRDLIAWLMDKDPAEPAAAPKTGSTSEATTVAPAIAVTGDWQVTVAPAGGEPVALDVAPPPVIAVEREAIASLPVYNPAGGGWNNGARLAGNLAEACTTPGLIDIASIIVRPAGDPEAPAFVRGRDWEIENTWGTIGRIDGGAITADTPVLVSYRHSAQRLDSIVAGPDGIRIEPGRPVAACPLPPELAPADRRLANIHIPGPIAKLTTANLFPVLETAWPKPPPAATPEVLADIRRKLESGEPLRILAWGDSVTDAVYLPDDRKWQNQFAARLRTAFPNSRVEWLTEAWGGRTTLDFLNAPPGSGRNFQEQVVAARPDLVISEFVNDAHLPVESIAPQYDRILEALRSAGAAWIVLTPHYVRPDWMNLASEHDVDNDPRPYVAFVREFAAGHPVAVADAARRFGRLWRQGIPASTLLVNSINHPDDRGMALFADALMDLFPPTDP